MDEYKERYQKAIKALDESELESTEKIKGLYKALMGILGAVKGQHSFIDQAIAKLPTKVTNDQLPIVDLQCLKDLIVSHLGKTDSAGPASEVLDILLSTLTGLPEYKVEIDSLHDKLHRAQSSQEFVFIAQKLADVFLASVETEGNQVLPPNDSVKEIKEGLFFQLDQLEHSDSEMAHSLDIESLKDRLSKVESLRDLETFYKHVFERLGQRLSKKDAFIVELSGLIETVVQQLTELSMDFKKDGSAEELHSKDRWRLTELMGEQVDTLRKSVLQAESLTTLKVMISERMQELSTNVDELVEIEKSRLIEAGKHTKKIAGKLERVELEVSLLKSSLHKAHEQAFIDPLTGVANRRAFDQRMKLEFERWKRNQGLLVFAILDIDHFKKINDDHGHPVGDKVLKTISQLLNKQVRESDFFGRIGGEEFALILVDSDLENAMIRLNQFRELVYKCKFGLKGQRLVISVSVGCAKFGANDAPESIYERADKALFEAKNTGRNKCLSELDISS